MYVITSHKRLKVRPIHNWITGSSDRVILLLPKSQVFPGDDKLFKKLIVVDDYISPKTDESLNILANNHSALNIAGTSEVDVLRCAKVRDNFKLDGMSFDLAIKFRDKYLMSQICKQNNINSPDTILINSSTDLHKFSRLHDWKIIIKPRYGFGSVNVSKIVDVDSLNEWTLTTKSINEYYIAQNFIDAILFHVDGYCEAGVIVHCWPSVYNTGGYESIIRHTAHSSYLLQANDPRVAILQKFTYDVIASFNSEMNNFSFHLEVFMDEKNNPTFCEIACRPAGGAAVDSYEAAFGVSLFRQHILGQLGIKEESSFKKHPSSYSGWVTLKSKIGVVKSIPTFPFSSGIIKLGLPNIGDRFMAAKDITDAAGLVAVTAESSKDVSLLLQEIESWWINEVKWDN